MHKVVITDFIADDLAPEREALAGLATVEAFDAFHEDQFVGRDRSILIDSNHGSILTLDTVTCRRCSAWYNAATIGTSRIASRPVFLQFFSRPIGVGCPDSFLVIGFNRGD